MLQTKKEESHLTVFFFWLFFSLSRIGIMSISKFIKELYVGYLDLYITAVNIKIGIQIERNA